MKYIYIPDIHNKIEIADSIVTAHSERPLTVIYAGDYFDNFGDSPTIAAKTARWLVRHIFDSADEQATGLHRIHLIGNHDVPYLFPHLNEEFWCPGYTTEKALAVAAEHLHWYPGHFQLHTWLDSETVPSASWLLTHAGLTRSLFSDEYEGLDIPEIEEMLAAEEEFLQKDGNPKKLLFLSPGYRMHGNVKRREPHKDREKDSAVGGITWCDWDHEFEPIAGINQLVGHTPDTYIRGKNIPSSINICADTHLRHYGVFSNLTGKLVFYSGDELDNHTEGSI